MKYLAALSIIQIIAILFLYTKIADLEGNFDRAATVAPTDARRPDPAPAQSFPLTNDNHPNVDKDLLRLIIREELAVHRDNEREPDTAAEPAPVLSGAEQAEYERRRMQVEEQLNYFTGVGRISDAEMQRLQSEIARLDPASRREMLMELNRALNSGRLEGRL